MDATAALVDDRQDALRRSQGSFRDRMRRPVEPESAMKPTSLLGAAAICCVSLASHAAEPSQIALKAGCTVCHTVNKKIIGPTFREIAAKYKGKPNAVAALSQQVRKGSVGVWGTVPMVPSDATKISDADLASLITWILKTPQT
jgi:cytochrome c